MNIPFAYAFAYMIKQTPYAFVAKIILCMYLLYNSTAAEILYKTCTSTNSLLDFPKGHLSSSFAGAASKQRVDTIKRDR